MASSSSSLDADEVTRFSALADSWWNPRGPMRPLHQMTAPRLCFIREELARRGKNLAGASVIDMGCGAGLMSEALAEQGASVLGVDASPELIAAAKSHGASFSNLSYRCATAEALAAEKKTFDLVMALEVIEHVAAPRDFVKSCARLLRKDGVMIFSTLNRTPKSFMQAIIGAEYVLRLIPRGTHEWKKFITPSELAEMIKAAGLTPQRITGLALNPLKNTFSLNERDVAVDYLISAC